MEDIKYEPELNPALQDLEEINLTRPDLTPDEWQIVGKASDWLKATLKPEVRTELEVAFIKKQAEFQDELQKETQELIRKSMEDWRAEQEPMNEKELAQLLSQEYLDFKLTLRIGKETQVREYTISELPAQVEIRFVKSAQKYLIPLMEAVNSSEWNLDNTVVSKILQMLETIPEAAKAAADLAAISLDPWEEKPSENGEWVLKHISIKRIADIIIAQSEANRYRDFFLNGSRAYRSLTKR